MIVWYGLWDMLLEWDAKFCKCPDSLAPLDSDIPVPDILCTVANVVEWWVYSYAVYSAVV